MTVPPIFQVRPKQNSPFPITAWQTFSVWTTSPVALRWVACHGPHPYVQFENNARALIEIGLAVVHDQSMQPKHY